MPDIRRLSTPFSYALAVCAGEFVFLGLHRGGGNDFTTQFGDTFAHLSDTLEEVGLTLADLVKVHVWLKYIEDLPEMEQGFRRYFDEDAFPARMTATTEFIDADCLLMIEGVAYRGTAT